jgi:hypothetical protein
MAADFAERPTSATGTWKRTAQTGTCHELTSEQRRDKTRVPVRSMELLGLRRIIGYQ